MHFDQQTMMRIRETAANLERARVRLDSAQKASADWDVIQQRQTEFDAAQEAMIAAGLEANASLPRSIQGEAA